MTTYGLQGHVQGFLPGSSTVSLVKLEMRYCMPQDGREAYLPPQRNNNNMGFFFFTYYEGGFLDPSFSRIARLFNYSVAFAYYS